MPFVHEEYNMGFFDLLICARTAKVGASVANFQNTRETSIQTKCESSRGHLEQGWPDKFFAAENTVKSKSQIFELFLQKHQSFERVLPKLPLANLRRHFGMWIY